MHVYILKINDIETVSDSFRHAMRGAAIQLVPDVRERAHLKKLDRSPELSRINAAGSFYHLLRYINERGDNAEFVIREHLVGGSPGVPTLSRLIDLNEGPDPSYKVQAALWDRAQHGDEVSLDDTACGIEDELREAITSRRSEGAGDETILEELKWMEGRMRGLEVIPSIGRPSSILDRLPHVAAEVFVEIYREAFAS